MKFKVVASNTLPNEILLDVEDTLSKAFNAEVTIELISEVPNEYYNSLRAQYRADMVNLWLLNTYYGKFRLWDYLIALLDVDAYVPGLNFVFGLASPSLKVASIYTYRLRFTYPGITLSRSELFKIRVRKEVLHEVGHLLGLDHCSNSRCVMFFSNSIFDTDNKEWKYCSRCALKLEHRGVYLSRDFILD